MNAALHLRVAGALLLALAACHGMFSKRFGWDRELQRLSLLNRQIFIVHTMFIVLILVMFGMLSLFGASLLLTPTPLGLAVAGGILVFWIVRLIVQWFVYDWRLWRGNRFRTGVHLGFTILWCYLVLAFGLAFRAQLGVD